MRKRIQRVNNVGGLGPLQVAAGAAITDVASWEHRSWGREVGPGPEGLGHLVPRTAGSHPKFLSKGAEQLEKAFLTMKDHSGDCAASRLIGIWVWVDFMALNI